MLRSTSDSTTSPSSTRKRLFTRASNPLSTNSKSGPLLDVNPLPVIRLSLDESEPKKSFRSIKTKFQAAGTPLKLLRRLSNSSGQPKPRIARDGTPSLSKVKVKRGRGRSYSLHAERPPSILRSLSAPGAPPNLSQSSISQTLSMSNSSYCASVTDSDVTSTLFQDVQVPIDLQTGVTVTKVSQKESKKVTVRIDADLGQIFYQSRRARISESLTLFCRFPESWSARRSFVSLSTPAIPVD